MLSSRLLKVASFVDKGVIVADIGSDHAYLPCYLVKHQIVHKAYAMEVVVGPLNQSIKTINENGLSDSVIPILSDGLSNIAEDVEEVIIAGMGGLTILEILKNDFNKLGLYKKIIVQANSHMFEIRNFINEHQFKIIEEAIIKDGHKYYEILSFNTTKGSLLNPIDIKYGPLLIKQQDDTFIEYYKLQLINYQNILAKMPKVNPRFSEIETNINELKTILK